MGFALSDERSRVRERFGLLPPELVARLDALERRPVWVQAVSVGEVMLARTLLDALARREAQGCAPVPVVLSSTTAAGCALAGTIRAPRLHAVFRFPLDLPRFVDRTLGAVRPAAYVSVETEIWPVLLRRCAARGIPAFLVNGRISARSRARYRLVRPFLRRSLEAIRLACMQTPEDADRIASIGLPPDRVEVTGNMKFDGATGSPPPAGLADQVSRLSAGAAVVVAGSTCEGEEEMVLDAVAAAGGPFLILAPRHPERFEAVAALLRARGVAFARRSAPASGPDPGPAPGRDSGPDPGRASGPDRGRASGPDRGPARVLLLDSVGELASAYALAAAAFVGGSLVPRGGQNMIEPAAHGVPSLFGPHTQHFAAVAEALISSGGSRRVRDAADLGRGLAHWLGEAGDRRRAGEAARRLVLGHRGATERTLDHLLPWIASDAGAERAGGSGCA